MFGKSLANLFLFVQNLCSYLCKYLQYLRSYLFLFVFLFVFLFCISKCVFLFEQFIYVALLCWTANNAMILFLLSLCWTVINTSYFLFCFGERVSPHFF